MIFVNYERYDADFGCYYAILHPVEFLKNILKHLQKISFTKYWTYGGQNRHQIGRKAVKLSISEIISYDVSTSSTRLQGLKNVQTLLKSIQTQQNDVPL